MSYLHLTISERAKIEMLDDLKCSIQGIADQLGSSPSTIPRELNRNKGEQSYCAESAQEVYAVKKKLCVAKTKYKPETTKTIQQKMAQTWSPEQISNRLFKGNYCFKTLYCWIYKKLLEVPLSTFRQKGKQRKPHEKRNRFNIVIPLASNIRLDMGRNLRLTTKRKIVNRCI